MARARFGAALVRDWVTGLRDVLAGARRVSAASVGHVVRAGVAASVAGLGVLAVTATPSYAIAPFNGYSCAPNPMPVTVPSSGPSTASVSIPAGQRLNVAVTGATVGRILRQGGGDIINIPLGMTTGGIDNAGAGPLNVTLEVPVGGDIFDAVLFAPITITFSCAALAVAPPGAPAGPPAPASLAQVLAGNLAVIKEREPMRVRGIYDSMFEASPWWWDYDPCCRDFSSREDYLSALDDAVAEQLAIEDRMAELAVRWATAATPAEQSAISVLMFELRRRWNVVDDDIACITESGFYRPGDIDDSEFAVRVDGHPRLAQRYDTIRPYFEGANGEADLGALGGWKFSALYDGAIIRNSFDAIDRQTRIGTLSVLGTRQLDDMTMLGLGLKLGGAVVNTSTPATQLDQMTLGADLALMRVLYPGLVAKLYAGAEYDWNRFNAGGAWGAFGSQTVKIGGGLQGRHALGDFVIVPEINSLFQFTNYNGFTDSLGTVYPGGSVMQLNLALGGRIMRDFYSPEHDKMFSPYIGGYFTYDAVTGTAWPGQTFTSGGRLQAIAGVELNWHNSVKAHVQADATFGQGFHSLGLTAKLHGNIAE